MNGLWHFKPGVMYRLLKSPEYVEFRKVIVLQEARFMEITEEGEGIRSVHLALTADTLFIAEKCLPDYVKQPEVWTESDPELEGVELISILPLDASDIVVQDDRKYKRIHVDLPNGTARHYEYAETVRSERIWKSWVQDVAVLNRQQTEDAESHVNLTVIRVTTTKYVSSSESSDEDEEEPSRAQRRRDFLGAGSASAAAVVAPDINTIMAGAGSRSRTSTTAKTLTMRNTHRKTTQQISSEREIDASSLQPVKCLVEKYNGFADRESKFATEKSSFSRFLSKAAYQLSQVPTMFSKKDIDSVSTIPLPVICNDTKEVKTPDPLLSNDSEKFKNQKDKSVSNLKLLEDSLKEKLVDKMNARAEDEGALCLPDLLNSTGLYSPNTPDTLTPHGSQSDCSVLAKYQRQEGHRGLGYHMDRIQLLRMLSVPTVLKGGASFLEDYYRNKDEVSAERCKRKKLSASLSLKSLFPKLTKEERHLKAEIHQLRSKSDLNFTINQAGRMIDGECLMSSHALSSDYQKTSHGERSSRSDVFRDMSSPQDLQTGPNGQRCRKMSGPQSQYTEPPDDVSGARRPSFSVSARKRLSRLPGLGHLLQSPEDQRATANNHLEDVLTHDIHAASNTAGVDTYFRKRRGVCERPELITDLSVDALATELTLIDKELLVRIHSSELVDCIWTQKDKYVRAPNVMMAIAFFDRVANLVATEVLLPDTPEERARIIVKFILVADRLRHMKNFNSLRAILGGLQLTPIYRLTDTWNSVKEKFSRKYKIYQDLSELMSHEKNHCRYRAALEKALHKPPCLPFIGVFLQTVLAVDTARRVAGRKQKQKSRQQHGAERHPHRRRSGFGSLSPQEEESDREKLPHLDPKKTLFKYQMSAIQYTFPSNQSVRRFLLKAQYNTDDVNYQVSCQKESRKTTSVC